MSNWVTPPGVYRTTAGACFYVLFLLLDGINLEGDTILENDLLLQPIKSCLFL